MNRLARAGQTRHPFELVRGEIERDVMRQFAEKLSVSEYVTFTGRAPDEPTHEMLSTADDCVNPDAANAMNHNSTLNKIMEFMALGRPIGQFNMTEGCRSAMDASVYAKQNDETDFSCKILKLIVDEERRKHMGDYRRRRIDEELQWSSEAQSLIPPKICFASRSPT